NGSEREAVLASALRTHGRDKIKIDLARVSDACEKFNGAEIAALVPDALFAAFNDGEREINTMDLLAAAKNLTPLAKSAAAKIEALRTGGKANARAASLPEQQTTTRSKRVLDLA